MATNEELRPSNRPAPAGRLPGRTLIGIAAFAITAALVLFDGRTTHEPNRPAAFLGDALGEAQPAAALERRSGEGTARIRGEHLVVESPRGERVALRARLAGRSAWKRHANGTWRATDFGSEAITIGTDDPEHFLTVDRRAGRKTWEWELGTVLVARLLPSGGVGFVDSKTHRVADLTIAPVAIFDAAGEDVTPKGLRWQLGDGGRTLELNLNDESLPEPYVIDPAFRSIGAVAAGTTATVVPAIPAGVLAGDQLVAFVSSTAATATLDVAPPTGWTLVRTDLSTTFVKLWTFRKQATGSEPGSYTFTFQDPTGTNVSKTSRAIVAAYSGIRSSAPIDGQYGNDSAGASNRTANVPGVTTTGTNRISIWTVANSGTSTVTNPTINAIATAERIDSNVAPSLEIADAAEPTAFGPATVGSGNVLSANARWAAQVFNLIPDTTAPTQTLSVSEATNTAGQYYNTTTKTHYYNTAAGGTFTVDSVPADTDSGINSVAFNAVALTGFTHTLVTDTTSPYASNTYTWTNANTVSPGASRVTVTDRNAQTLTELTITRDVTQPTVFTLNAPSGGAFIRNGATVSVVAASPTDADAGVADVAFRACPGSNGCTWTDGDAFTVGSDTSDQYSVTWPVGQVDGAYQLIARATDNVANTRDTASPVAVTLDNTNPAFGTLSIGSPANASLTGTTVYFRSGVAGSFTLSQPLTDTGGSGPASVQFPAIATTGWTHANETVSGPSPYGSSTFSWTAAPSTPSGYTLTGADAVGNAQTRGLSFVDDSTVPVGGALTVNGTVASGGGSQSYDADGSFTIDLRTDYTDAGSGIATSTLAREDGTLSANNCAGYGAPATLIGTPLQSGLATGCYRYVLTGTDNVGNSVALTTVVKVDTTAPGAPGLTLSDTSADVHTTATTAYYRPAGTGAFDVSASSTDAQSGVLDYAFPALAGFTGAGAGATRTYTLATPTEADGAKPVTARNNALLDSTASTFTLTADSTGPIGGALTVAGTVATGPGAQSYDADGSFSIELRTDYTDAGSGIATSTLAREDGTLSANSCAGYGAPATLIGTPFQSGLATGCYRYTLTGTDNVGNASSLTTVVKVDTSNPSGSITSPTDAANVRGTIALSADSADGGSGVATVQFQRSPIGAGTWTNQAASWNTSLQSDGQYDLRVITTDNAGNSFTSATITVRVDNTNPTGAVTFPADAANVRGTITLTSNSADTGGSGVATVQFQRSPIGAGTWTNQAASWDTTAQSDGDYDVRVTTTDNAGNASTSGAVTITLDNTAPNTTITAQPSNPTGSSAASFSFTSSETGSTFECRLDGGSWGACTSPKSYSGLADGSRTFDVRATDETGNLDLSPATFTWTVDTVAPNTTITANPANPTNATGATFTFTASEGGSTFECRLDGGSWGACTTPRSYVSLTEVSHTFDVRATDAAANTDASPASYTWSIDVTNPTGTVTAPATGAHVRATIPLAGNSADGGSGVASVVFERSPAGAGTWTATPTSWDTTGVGDGDYDLRVVTADAAGNVFTSGAITITVDNTPPNTSITAQPVNPTNTTGASISFNSSEAGSTFECRLGAGSWGACTSPKSYSGLAEGSHTFEVRATDLAGNLDPTPASYTWTIDLTAPNTSITAQPPNPTNATGASFSFTASEGGSSFECRLDGGSWSGCTSPKSYTGLTEGSHIFDVRATDPAGNTDETPASFTWTVDLTGPNTTLTTPSNPSSDPTPTFTLLSTETPSTFECSLDAAGWSSCATPYTIAPALADGSHTLEVRATDAAGNTDATPATYTWVVDATTPTGNVTSPANGADSSGTTVALASNSADSGSGVASVVFQRSPAGMATWTNQASPWDTTLQTDGDYDLRVSTTDQAGNTFTSAPITVTVDNTAPSLTVNVDTTINIASPDPETIGATATDTGTGIDYVKFEQCNSPGATCGVSDWTTLTIDTSLPYSVAWPLPTDGVRLLAVTAADNAGRQTFQTVPVTIDRTAPTTALTAPTAAANLRGTAPVAASASDPAPGGVQLVEFQLTVDGGAYTDPAFASDSSSPFTGNLVTTGHADGLYDLRAFTSDVSGNSTASTRVTVRIDNTAPTGSVTAPSASANLRGATVALTSNSADPGGSGVATVQFERSPAGAGTWTNQGATFDTTAGADGLYDLRVVTTDNAGNAFTSGIVTVRVDNTLPTGSVTSPSAAADVRGSITLTSDSADSGSGVATAQFQRSPAGLSTWTNQAAGWNTALQADGQYDVRVVTTDNAGNVFTSPTITIRVDNTAPTGSVTAPVAGTEVGVPPVSLTSDSADVGGSGVDTIVFERSPAGANTWTATAASWDTASGPDSVGDGSYDLRVKTTDRAGNSFSSAVVTVLVDHTAPITSASLAPGSPSNAPVTVSFTAGDGSGSGVSTTSYRVDGGSLLLGSSVVIGAPGDHSNDGNHVVQFFSTDDVGNVETPKTVNVLIDTTAPSGTPGNPGDYLRGIANLTYSTAATDVSSVQFQFSPASAGAWSNIGAADIAPPYEASWTTTLVADGPYDLRAVVTDATGNVANELLPSLPKTVDNTAPSGAVTSPAAAMYVSGSVNVTATASDGAPPVSGVSAVRFEVKPSGAGSFTVFGTQTAPVFGSTYQQSLATGSFTDGPADLQVVVTDVAGNETTSAARTISIDNVAPTVTLDNPGAAVGASVNLSASSSADTTNVTFRYRPVGSGGAGTLISSDGTAPFATTWSTSPAAEQQWELIAVATDGGGNIATSAPRIVFVDRTLPTGNLTAPQSGASVGGPAVTLAASVADVSGSGVAQVEWQVKLFGSGSFNAVASDTSAPYEGAWNAAGAPDGATEIRALITDAAGNVRTTAVIPVTVDSTGPSVTLTDPGAVVSGTVGLNVTTGGGAVRVVFGVSPAGAGTWTEIASDTSAPFGTSFDTRTVADGLHDLRAIGYDSLGNPSSPSVRANVRVDNVAPKLVASAPGDGSVSASANQIVLTASEPVTAPGAQLDGVPAPAPTVSGSTLTFATGALSDGLHVLSGELEDASGARIPFRVAVTIESTVGADRPPVEMSAQPGGPSTLTAPSGLASATMPAAAWPTLPSSSDFIVLQVDLSPPAPVVDPGLLPGTQMVEVTAHWALASTSITEFEAPLDILIPTTDTPVVPAVSQTGASWRIIQPLDGANLQAGQRDGFYRDAAGIHILTRHLTYFSLLRDDEAPSEPRDVAGVVAGDGLTIRWSPGSDLSGQLGNVVLFVNGEPYRNFGPTEYEAKLGAFAAGDTRTFTLAQLDAAGNMSRQTRALRAVPSLTGKSLADATASLGAAGFALGRVLEQPIATVVPGTVVGPAHLRLALESSAIDLVVARGVASPETKLVFSITGSKKLTLRKERGTTIAARIKVSRPANVTATLHTAKEQRLHTWQLKVKAGANVVKLRLPPHIRRPGRYSLTWVARSETETIRRTLNVTLVGPKSAPTPKREVIEVVLASEQPAKAALQRGLSTTATRVVATASPDQTFELTASAARNVGVVVVDVDAYGLGFLSDLRTVFPSLRLIAIAREPATRMLAIRAGAVLALPRNTPARQLAKAIGAVAGR